MRQVIDGLDNDVLFIILFFTLLISVLIPFYVFRPTQNLLSSSVRNDSRAGLSNNVEQSTNPVNDGGLFVSPNTNEVNTASTARMLYPEFQEPFTNQDEISSRRNSSISNDAISVKIIHNEVFYLHSVSKYMKLMDLKKKCFPLEYESAKNVRFIFSGRILNADACTLSDLNIIDGSVIHCVISEQVLDHERRSSDSSVPRDIDMSGIFIPLLSTTIILIWIAVFMYSHLFSVTSISILGVISVLFFVMWFFSMG